MIERDQQQTADVDAAAPAPAAAAPDHGDAGAANPIPLWKPDHEASERGVVYGPGGLEDVFCFATHIEAAKMWFSKNHIAHPHGFEPH